MLLSLLSSCGTPFVCGWQAGRQAALAPDERNNRAHVKENKKNVQDALYSEAAAAAAAAVVVSSAGYKTTTRHPWASYYSYLTVLFLLKRRIIIRMKTQ